MPKYRRTSTSYEKSRLKYLLWLLIRKYQPNCYLCHQPFVYEDVLPSRGSDNLTVHHNDEAEDDSKLEEQHLAHRHCHKVYHAKDNIHRGGR
jgi:hypothetical protein